MSPDQISKNVLLIFHRDIMYKPIIFHATKAYDILFNVLEAKILHRQEGRIVLQLQGKQDEVEKAIEYMEQEGVKVEVLADRIKRDMERCVHCGACTGVCKAAALWIDRASMEVMFDPEHCVVCGQCQLACPVQAISMASIDMDIPA